MGQSSSDLAKDVDVETCSETLIENTTWWKAVLPKDVTVHSMVLKTGNVFPCEYLNIQWRS